MRLIWLTRHGNRLDFVDPDWRKSAEYPDDPPLSPDGFEQARQTGRALQGQGISEIVSSPFQRCVQTGGEIAEILDVPIRLEWGLAEWLNPTWFSAEPVLRPVPVPENLRWRIDRSYDSIGKPSFPETKVQMYRRVAGTARLLSQRGTGKALWVGHGASIQGATAALLGVPASEADGVLNGIPCCCLVQLIRGPGRWVVGQKCSTSHLSRVTAEGRFDPSS